jgi:hypothetical protein
MRKIALLLLAAILCGCSSEPQKPAETPQPKASATPSAPELMTGRSAFYECYRKARTWAPDAKPYRVESSASKDSPGTDGKAIVWHAWFASPSRRSVKPYTWSGGSGENLPEKGVTFGPDDSFSPTNASTQPFDVGFLKTDSDNAYKVAQEKGGTELEKKHPGTPVTYILDWNGKANELIWHVIYGDSPNEARLRIAVDAATGGFLRKEK